MNKPVVFIPDGNWYLHRIFYTLNEPRGGWKGTAKRDAVLSRMLNTICSDAIHAKATHLAVAFDGNDVFRYEVYPMYKANREGRDEKGGINPTEKREVYEYLKPLIAYLKAAGIPVIQKPKYEADDIMASLAFGSKGRAIIYLGSRDKDLYQCLTSTVKLLFKDPVTKQYTTVGVEEAQERLGGIRIDQMVEYQMLIGDTTDNIPQAKPKMGPKTAQKLLLEHGSIKGCFEQSKKDRVWLTTARSLLQTNRKLVTMVKDCYRPKLSELRVEHRPDFDHRGYQSMCRELGFNKGVEIATSRGATVASLLRKKRRLK